MTVEPATLDRFVAIVGERHAIRDATEMQPYMREWRDWWIGISPLVLRPDSTEQVSRIMALASETSTPIVPQSGNTGLMGGQIPRETGGEVLLSLDRMTRIREIDAADNTMTVEAGVILRAIQEAALGANRFFPLSLEAEGSCRIGGNLSTNAGGLGVLAYGNARDLCLGLEVVLADGRIWDGLRRLRKNNTGYDLKHLFIGAEGTLGVITAAVLKLFPKPLSFETALVALPSPQAAIDLLSLAREASGNRVTAIELLPRNGFEFTMKHFATRDPFAVPAPWYVLLEFTDSTAMESALEKAAEQGIVVDAVIASSEAQRKELWKIREDIVEVQRKEGGSIKHDVSVPISQIPKLVEQGLAAVEKAMPGARPMPFGHVGDGNLHFNVSQPVGMDKGAFLDRWHEISDPLYQVVLSLGGSVSAEHGIGRMKRDMMPMIKSPVELAMMRQLKAQLDPLNILNPGKLIPDR